MERDGGSIQVLLSLELEDWGLLWGPVSHTLEDSITCTCASSNHHQVASVEMHFVINLGDKHQKGPACWCWNRSAHLLVNFTNGCEAPVVHLELCRYKDKCKWHCLPGVYDLAKDRGVYLVYCIMYVISWWCGWKAVQEQRRELCVLPGFCLTERQAEGIPGRGTYTGRCRTTRKSTTPWRHDVAQCDWSTNSR